MNNERNLLPSKTYHFELDLEQQNQDILEWSEDKIPLFNELLISWNGCRLESDFEFWVSIKVEDWSLWHPFAHWMAHEQQTFVIRDVQNHFVIEQDMIRITKGHFATGFKVRLKKNGKNGKIFAIHACTTLTEDILLWKSHPYLSTEIINISGLSQTALNTPISRRICSPTSTTAVIRFLMSSTHIDPIAFAAKARDHAFDIYGNWALNVAAASSILGDSWRCWVARINHLEELKDYLQCGTPLVASIKGKLLGAPQEYPSGHLVVIRGIDTISKKVYCMDPAFESDQKTLVAYDIDAFLQAWNQRHYLAYLFATPSIEGVAKIEN